MGLPIVRVQHHHAHVRACMAEHGLSAPLLGVAWDGTGLGLDDTVWGGEFLRVAPSGFERIAHLRTFRLPGGERAVRGTAPRGAGTPVRTARRGAVYSRGSGTLRGFSSVERGVLRGLLRGGFNAPWTSSAGRLFDAVASLLDIRQTVAFEGQAAMELEFAVEGSETVGAYPFDLAESGVIDWGPMVRAILEDLILGSAVETIARRFHDTLAEIIVAAARRTGEQTVALSGGCFQNAYLLEQTVTRLARPASAPSGRSASRPTMAVSLWAKSWLRSRIRIGAWRPHPDSPRPAAVGRSGPPAGCRRRSRPWRCACRPWRWRCAGPRSGSAVRSSALAGSGGSGSVTSRPAAKMTPFFSASIRSFSTTIGPRAVLTNTAVGFILRNVVGVEQAARRLVQIGVDRDEIRLRQQRIEIDLPGVQVRLGLLVAVHVVIEHLHVPAEVAAAGQGVADASHADDAERAAGQILTEMAQRLPRLPLAGLAVMHGHRPAAAPRR